MVTTDWQPVSLPHALWKQAVMGFEYRGQMLAGSTCAVEGQLTKSAPFHSCSLRRKVAPWDLLPFMATRYVIMTTPAPITAS